MPTVKLSSAQKHVLQRLTDGWKLTASSGIGYRLHSADNREHESVHSSTAHALSVRLFIKPGEWSFPSREWHITERGSAKLAGKKVEEDVDRLPLWWNKASYSCSA